MKNKIPLLCILIFCTIGRVIAQSPANNTDVNFPYKNLPEILPGTKPLTWEGDLSAKMLDGAHKFIEEKINESIVDRLKLWNRDFSSGKAYEISVEPNRKRLMKCIGVEDKTEPFKNYNTGLEDKNPPVFMQKFSIDSDPDLIAETSKYRVYQVRWPVLNRVNGEGLLLQPKSKPIANIIAIPDAGQEPEQLVGLLPGIPVESQFARQLAENGFQVLIPVLISRDYLFPGKEQQQTYREWIYRQAFQMGRHIIGYEVQKVLSAIDWFKQSKDKDVKIGVAGYCEGGLIAFYATAVDKRIDAALVSGYFNSRQKVWDEPIYRNVWGLLSEFGDAEIASLIAPRPLVIEHSRIPDIIDKMQKLQENPMVVEGLTFTGYKGKLQTAQIKDVQTEYNRIDELTKPGFQPGDLIIGTANKPVSFGSAKAIEKFTSFLGHSSSLVLANEIPLDKRSSFDPKERQMRQVKE
ncbi:MAG: dienelactone hydrolase family protein, partial [Chitinophagaceae bacterium]